MSFGGVDRAQARREEHEALAHHYPPLAGLTAEEFDRFVEAALARAGPQRASDAFARLMQFSAVLITAVVVFLGCLSTMSRGAPPFVEPLPRSAAGLLAGIPAAGIVLAGRMLIGRARARAERRSRVLAVKSAMLAGPRCTGCGYTLDGCPPMDGYPNVVKCPECGLVNPVTTHGADPRFNAP
ncbi:MAG: hypothetical protein IT436_11190 [Phycisphaerales bacterium]|nr:hypothetical protein [Phycisphaerales bacterium]